MSHLQEYESALQNGDDADGRRKLSCVLLQVIAEALRSESGADLLQLGPECWPEDTTDEAKERVAKFATSLSETVVWFWRARKTIAALAFDQGPLRAMMLLEQCFNELPSEVVNDLGNFLEEFNSKSSSGLLKQLQCVVQLLEDQRLQKSQG